MLWAQLEYDYEWCLLWEKCLSARRWWKMANINFYFSIVNKVTDPNDKNIGTVTFWYGTLVTISAVRIRCSNKSYSRKCSNFVWSSRTVTNEGSLWNKSYKHIMHRCKMTYSLGSIRWSSLVDLSHSRPLFRHLSSWVLFLREVGFSIHRTPISLGTPVILNTIEVYSQIENTVPSHRPM